MEQKKQSKWIEPLAVIVFLSASVVLRMQYVNKHIDFLSGSNQLLEEVMLTTGNVIEYTIYGCKYLYAGILEILFSLLGNKPILSVYFQVFLQCGAIILLYFAVRNMVGRAGAFFSLLCCACIPYVSTAATGQFLLAAFAVYFLLNVNLWDCLRQEKQTAKSQMVRTILTALLTSSFAYLDAIGILFSLTSLLAILLFAKKTKIGLTISYLVSTLVGYGMIMGTIFLVQGGNVWDYIMDYVRLYGSQASRSFSFMEQIEGTVVSIPLLFAFGSLLCLLYLVGMIKGNVKFGILITIFSVGMIGLQVEGIGTNDYFPIFVLGVIVLLGNGIQALFPRKKKISLEETIVVQAEEILTKEELPTQEETPMKEETKPVINYIDNPLPLPKKHVKKEMTYAFEPEKEWMKFDLEDMEDKNDFDLT